MDNPMGYTGAELQAYEMGYNEYRGDPVSREDMMMNMGYLYDTARWANILLPKLRSMAGYEDSGYGTWTELTGEAQDLEALAWEHHGGGTWEQMTDRAPDESYEMVFDAFMHGLDTGYFMDDDVASAL